MGENGASVVRDRQPAECHTGATLGQLFALVDGTAVSGIDYMAHPNGVLKFADGQTSTNVTVTILNPGVLENSKTFNFVLSNPVSAISTNCYLVAPSNAVITITNTVTAHRFFQRDLYR